MRAKPDISIIMPAYRCEATIASAAASALSGQGVEVELVIASDDGVDYRRHLGALGFDLQNIVQVMTPSRPSGPSAARNLALTIAQAPLIAALDADDRYAPGRLRSVLDAMDRQGLGAGTGPTEERSFGGALKRVAAASKFISRLSLPEICGLRMPFSPVFDRSLAPEWPPVRFAEDMVLNAHLCVAAGGYAFAEDARYLYVIQPESVVQGPSSLRDAINGYDDILSWIGGSWVAEDARDEIVRVISEDRDTAVKALAERCTSWRDAFRDAQS